ncbi:MAG: heterodisulfide reductase subunit B [Bacteroidales bacterium]|nr:heterodisulfide reductase subunit B [Bacteroidales bacterium]
MIIEGKKKIWQEYQKEIADDHYFYVRSCVRQNFFPGSEKAFLRIMQEELGKDVYENAAHTTCSGIGYHSDVVPFDTAMTVIARQFALMTESGYEHFVTSCITSFGLYSEVLETWKHFPDVLTRIRGFLKEATGREFEIPRNVAHASDVIFRFRKEITARGKFRLVHHQTGQPLRVVEHIGCHYSKMFPSKGVGGAEYPYVLVGMVEEWGGEVIDYPERRHCCGFGFRQYVVRANRGYSLANSKKKFESMKPYKPDFILTNCPGCPMFFDRWQYTLSEMEGVTYGENGEGIPVLTYEELAGLILGYDPWDLGFQVHQVPVEPLLDKIGIPYDPSRKFLGKEGQDLGKPASPTVLKFF